MYGVGCMIEDIDAVHRIYELKNRDYSKPLAILTPNANIEKFLRAPPPIVLINSKKPRLFVKFSVPGTLIEIPRINTVRQTNVK